MTRELRQAAAMSRKLRQASCKQQQEAASCNTGRGPTGSPAPHPLAGAATGRPPAEAVSRRLLLLLLGAVRLPPLAAARCTFLHLHTFPHFAADQTHRRWSRSGAETSTPLGPRAGDTEPDPTPGRPRAPPHVICDLAMAAGHGPCRVTLSPLCDRFLTSGQTDGQWSKTAPLDGVTLSPPRLWPLPRRAPHLPRLLSARPPSVRAPPLALRRMLRSSSILTGRPLALARTRPTARPSPRRAAAATRRARSARAVPAAP